MPLTQFKLRKLRWIVLIPLAACGGWIVRQIRRLLRQPPRVIHGTYPMHTVPHMVRIDRLAGFPSRSVVNHSKLAPYALVTSTDYDLVLGESGYASDELHWAFVTKVLWSADIWVTFFDSLMSPDLLRHDRLLEFIRSFGVRLIVLSNGLDVVYMDDRTTRYDWVGRVQADYPDWDLRAESLLRPARHASFCRHASFVIGEDSPSRRFIPRADLSFKYDTIDVDSVAPIYDPGNEVPVIVHAPNHRAVKGTEFLLRALERLQTRGYRFELELIEKTPHAHAMEIYRTADIVAEQFCMGTHAMFAIEGLALGKPVLTYMDQEHLGNPVFCLPLINTVPENIERVLAVLLVTPELRLRIGRAGRAFAEKYQSYGAMAEVWRLIYDHVWWRRPLNLHHSALFDPARRPRSFTEDPCKADFWPVPVDDLIGEIQAIASDPSLIDPGIKELLVPGRFRGN